MVLLLLIGTDTTWMTHSNCRYAVLYLVFIFLSPFVLKLRTYAIRRLMHVAHNVPIAFILIFLWCPKIIHGLACSKLHLYCEVLRHYILCIGMRQISLFHLFYGAMKQLGILTL